MKEVVGCVKDHLARKASKWIWGGQDFPPVSGLPEGQAGGPRSLMKWLAAEKKAEATERLNRIKIFLKPATDDAPPTQAQTTHWVKRLFPKNTVEANVEPSEGDQESQD